MSVCKVLGTYSPKDVQVVITGTTKEINHVVNGTVDGTFISVSRLIPRAEMYNGADSSNIRVLRDIENHEITLTLHQGSESNDVLSQLFALDKQHRRGEYLFNVLIKDSGGRTLVSATNCFISSPPDLEYGVEVSERPWVITAVCADVFIGGHARFTQDTANTLQELELEIDDSWMPVN